MWLVTGATGHVGNVLVRKLLERGEKVRALILPGESRESISGLNVEAFEGDILNLDSLFKSIEGVRGVFHLAGVISIMPGPNPFVRKVNVDGTKNILRAAKEKKVKKLVYTRSIHAIQRVEEGVIDETLPYDPDNPYGTYDRAKALYIHWHGGNYGTGKDELLQGQKVLPAYAPVLAEKGIVTLAIDSWCFGQRQHDKDGRNGEWDAFKLMLWKGQVLYGMMLFDEFQAVTYLTRPPRSRSRAHRRVRHLDGRHEGLVAGGPRSAHLRCASTCAA